MIYRGQNHRSQGTVSTGEWTLIAGAPTYGVIVKVRYRVQEAAPTSDGKVYLNLSSYIPLFQHFFQNNQRHLLYGAVFK